VLASIAGGGAVVHFSVHQCTGFGAFHCTPLPDLSTSFWVEPTSTGDTRLRGALRNAGLGCEHGRSIPFSDIRYCVVRGRKSIVVVRQREDLFGRINATHDVVPE
jgi:hypothetical protein